jgi:hypothetical protein
MWAGHMRPVPLPLTTAIAAHCVPWKQKQWTKHRCRFFSHFPTQFSLATGVWIQSRAGPRGIYDEKNRIRKTAIKMNLSLYFVILAAIAPLSIKILPLTPTIPDQGSTSYVPRLRNLYQLRPTVSALRVSVVSQGVCYKCISCVPRCLLQVYQLRPAFSKELYQLRHTACA